MVERRFPPAILFSVYSAPDDSFSDVCDGRLVPPVYPFLVGLILSSVSWCLETEAQVEEELVQVTVRQWQSWD